MTAPLLQIEGLTKRFGGLVAVSKIGFDIAGGEILGLIGPNGSGKSTVMKLIMGIERPDAGQVRLHGKDVAGWASHRVARAGIGLVFQHSRPLHRQTVLENIKLALLPDSLLRLAAAPGVDARARAIAERGGLGHVADRRPGTLPFADLRRLELAKAIARDPQVVLVDEPFAGLTSGEVAAFSELIRGFRNEGRAVLLVDHNVKGVSALVDRVFAMYLGERIAEGSAEAVMRDETVRRVYLGGSIEVASRPPATARDRAPLLQVEDVSVLYGKAQALERVSLHVHEGEFVSVVGLNGAGKTTLFNAVTGMVKPSHGEIVFNGKAITDHATHRLPKLGLARTFQIPRPFESMTVWENVLLAAYGGRCSQDAVNQAAWVVRTLDLEDLWLQPVVTLPAGHRRLIELGRALALQPDLILLDEVMAGMTQEELERVRGTIRAMASHGVGAVAGVEHVIRAIVDLADRIVVLDEGRLIASGPPDAILRDPEVVRAYLGGELPT